MVLRGGLRILLCVITTVLFVLEVVDSGSSFVRAELSSVSTAVADFAPGGESDADAPAEGSGHSDCDVSPVCHSAIPHFAQLRLDISASKVRFESRSVIRLSYAPRGIERPPRPVLLSETV